MKIYTITTPVEGMHEPTYDEVLLSGYTAGYESGYTDGQEECRDYSREYFTIEALEDGVLNVRKACYYSINDAEWVNISRTPFTIELHEGDKVRFKDNGRPMKNNAFENNTIRFVAYGNIESMEYGDDFIGRTIIINNSEFVSFFHDCTGLTSVENLILPAMTLKERCYEGMFNGCSSLTSSPILPATTMANSCYYGMFNYCTSLTTAPVLPATTLAQNCYASMFWGCTSLVTAPALPATTLAQNCYTSMFDSCTNLTTAPEFPATTLAPYCYSGMFYGCTNINYIKCLATDISASGCLNLWLSGVSPTGTFVKAAGVSWPTGNSGIPSGWTIIEE